MPRGIKGSGKAKPVSDSGNASKRGRKQEGVDVLSLPKSGKMGRKKKEAIAEKQPTKKPKGPKTIDPQAAEAELVRKYPNHKFKPGSLLLAGEDKDFPTRRTVVILCQDCDAERRVCTSDVFHVSRCMACGKKAKRKSATENDKK